MSTFTFPATASRRRQRSPEKSSAPITKRSKRSPPMRHGSTRRACRSTKRSSRRASASTHRGPSRSRRLQLRFGRCTRLLLPTLADDESAAQQIAGVAHRTLVATSRLVDDRAGAHVFFKCENLQRGGAFKFRGAFNALSRLSPDAARRGVVTFSSGNHAQAIALAGQVLDIPRVIVMPSDAPAVKRAATEGYGAEVVLYDREHEDREAIGRRLARDRGLTLVPPYDHAHIIAGQGTTALELFDDAGPLDFLFVPCGGGGLLSGCAIAARSR